MKSLKKLRLVDMNKDELQKKSMNELRGGNDGTPCGCGCWGSSSSSDNFSANYSHGYGSSGNGNGNCGCICGGSENGYDGGVSAAR